MPTEKHFENIGGKSGTLYLFDEEDDVTTQKKEISSLNFAGIDQFISAVIKIKDYSIESSRITIDNNGEVITKGWKIEEDGVIKNKRSFIARLEQNIRQNDGKNDVSVSKKKLEEEKAKLNVIITDRVTKDIGGELELIRSFVAGIKDEFKVVFGSKMYVTFDKDGKVLVDVLETKKPKNNDDDAPAAPKKK